ncbi:MAG TPA: TIM-barrel domain-containing protein [Terriglobia bacterium]|nr:TIM-barrel domain-containing protein [Terriglobia bacterium]
MNLASIAAELPQRFVILSPIALIIGLGLAPERAKAQWLPLNPVAAVERHPDSVVLTMQSGMLRLQVCTDSMIRIRYTPTGSFPSLPDIVVTKTSWSAVEWRLETTGNEISLVTARLKVNVARDSGTITFSNLTGGQLLQDGPRAMTPATVNGEKTYHVESVFKMYGSEEALYGLGQHQAGVWNYRGESVELSQENTNIAVPFLVSSNGYGLFWNNTSVTRFNNRFVNYLYVSSDMAEEIDYAFMYGPDFDKIIAGYRELTGAAPMYGKWAYGFWQCKNRYKSQEELLGIAHKYRELHIPVDNIVQDWFWWTTTGEFVFNKNYPDPQGMIDDLHHNHFHLMVSVWPFFYPGSATYQEMDKLGYFIDRTRVEGFHPKGTALYDAFNPEARKYYWNLIDRSLFKIGADAWWMDTTEPETEGTEENLLLRNKVALGNGARFANLYPLMATSTAYQGQRGASNQKRVFILSRSAFAGIQRNAVTAWSGDILSDFETFKRQVPAALNFSLSGLPYWTSDIGGFIMGHPDDPVYRELFVRWFQFGSFCPIFRVHGTRAPDQNELWSYGAEAQEILTHYDRLRYRLMPYIYSLAWKVASQSYTLMRPLVMDFASDARVLNIGDQFMFGSALLVSPVIEQGATMRHLYLPRGTRWYNFWGGETLGGGNIIDTPAPLPKIPLYVRAGSIVPMGPNIEYTTEKPPDPIELRVFPGADGSFTLYEDESDNYNYEQGIYATIPFHWNESAQTLLLGERKGGFPGMLQTRTFKIVFVKEGHGTGIEATARPDRTVPYSGKPVSITP